MTGTYSFASTDSGDWRTRPEHRGWLRDQAGALFDFFQYASIDPHGGFHDLDEDGKPIENTPRQIHSTGRMVHCFAIGSLLGRPGCDDIVDHGMDFLWNGHRDESHGGYMWSLDRDGPRDDSKQAYGHAFVLLAASGAKLLGHPLADRMIEDVTEILERRFWEEQHGAVAEEFSRDWSPISRYRGQNSNMHTTEALMAAFEATGKRDYLDKAERIAALVIGRHARAQGWRVGEHFDEDWDLDKSYRGPDQMFRPAGTTPGHWLEWSRLLLQLWVLRGRRVEWLPAAARDLFRRSVELGWDEAHGGFFYTLDWEDRPELRQKLWWPVTEAIGAAAFLCAHDPSPFHEEWYRRVWNFSANHLIDHRRGGWHPELSEDLRPVQTFFVGKPDLYHALQACLIPLYPAEGSLTREILAQNGRAGAARDPA